MSNEPEECADVCESRYIPPLAVIVRSVAALQALYGIGT